MSVLLQGLAPIQLERLADRLERPAISSDAEGIVRGMDLGPNHDAVTRELRVQLATRNPAILAIVLRAVAAERRAGTVSADQRLELVWTGPERDATATRETAVVVREMFQSAQTDVLVAGYALYNARSIFEPLAERMHGNSALRVRLVLNIAQEVGLTTEEEALRDFSRRMTRYHWPQDPFPAVYFDPRTFDARPERRAVMHAKCVLVDGRRSFLTSANLTEAAQVRNIELGVVINDATWCRAVIVQFDDLIARGLLKRLPA
jgi:phosphatidylserine/phosphatidylglycerophosphate/cardiolipin synthase-like enzyme